jgi:hypothetical protein
MEMANSLGFYYRAHTKWRDVCTHKREIRHFWFSSFLFRDFSGKF